jgi:signal transduction histidine kinase
MTDTNGRVDPSEGDPGSAAAGPGPFSLTPEQLLLINRLALQARLVSGMAHELNNSLQVMSGLVELLCDRTDLPEDVRSRVEKIGAQADRAGGVVRQVLASSREGMADRGEVELAAVIDRALALRRYQLGRAGIDVSWDRASSPRCRVRGDDRQLQQLFLNLLVNAEEALAGANPRGLRVTLDCGGGLARCLVEDTGSGVPTELRGRIFEPFFTTRPAERNVGLGLTAAAAIAAAHGGRLFVESAKTGGTFVLELPASNAASGG